MAEKVHEIVLPSGVFCRLRQPTWYDFCCTMPGPPEFLVMRLAQRIATFDGEARTTEQLNVMELDEFMPIATFVNDIIIRAKKNERGVG